MQQIADDMPHAHLPRVVGRELNRISFSDTVNNKAFYQFLYCLFEAQERGFEEVTLDFSKCTKAWPNGMLPILSTTDKLRRENFGVFAKLPEDSRLRRLFHNTNYAHFLDPKRFESRNSMYDQHMPAQRFADSDQQQKLVNAAVRVVMRNMELDRRVIAGLEWSINEITDNVLNHAQCEEGGIAQVSTLEGAKKIVFGVADSGQGILSSLREGYPDLQTDERAINEAIKAGTTRNPDNGQGNGLAGALRILTMSGGMFAITSGLSQLEVRSDQKDGTPVSKFYHQNERQRYHGTFVYGELCLDTVFDLAEALGFGDQPYEHTDIIELLYETEAEDAIILKLHDESIGFGTRLAGRQLRTTCMNLLNADPTKPLLLDWADVRLVSSSFADEFVGKLFAALGPLTFSARVRNLGMDDIVRRLVDKAIMQRAAQVTSSIDSNRGVP